MRVGPFAKMVYAADGTVDILTLRIRCSKPGLQAVLRI